MLFSRKRTIIFINREKIRWVEGQVPTGKFLGVVQDVACSEENLQVALADIAENFPKQVRIVVGEEFSYVTHFQKEDGQNSILGEAQALIPESLEEGWDSKVGDGDLVQVMAVQKQVFAVLKKALLENKIELEAMETESISLSRMVVQEKDQAVLFACYDGKTLLEVVQNGSVLATRIFFQFPSKEQVQEFLDYAANRKNILLKAFYVQDQAGELLKIFQALGLEIQELQLDPMVGIGRKKDIDGPDRKVLNIILGENAEKIEGKGGRAPFSNASIATDAGGKKGVSEPRTLREKVLLVAFVCIFLGGLVVSYYIYETRQKAARIIPQTQGVPIKAE